MVSTFLTNQAKETSEAAIAVPSSFVMCISGAHIKQQTSPGPVALPMFNRLGRFRLRVPELFTPASASIQYTEALSAFTNKTWYCCSLFSPIHAKLNKLFACMSCSEWWSGSRLLSCLLKLFGNGRREKSP